MAKLSAEELWLHSQAALKQAQSESGILDALIALNERFDTTPSQIATSEKHADDTRKIVFAIPDLVRRRKVIAATRTCHRLCRQAQKEELADLRKGLANGGASGPRSALYFTIAATLCAIAFGHFLWGTTGAVAAGAVSVLIGVDHLRTADSTVSAHLAQAGLDVNEQVAFIGELGTDGLFSAAEEMSGLPDSR